MKKKTKKKLIIGGSILAAIGTGICYYRYITSTGKEEDGEIVVIGNFSDGFKTGWNDWLKNNIVLSSRNIRPKFLRYCSYDGIYEIYENGGITEIPIGCGVEKIIKYKCGFFRRIIKGIENLNYIFRIISAEGVSDEDNNMKEIELACLKKLADLSKLKLVSTLGVDIKI